jgi:hypothetical protein
MHYLRAEHPSWTRDWGNFFRWIIGRKFRSDAKGMITVLSVMPPAEMSTVHYALLKNQQH